MPPSKLPDYERAGLQRAVLLTCKDAPLTMSQIQATPEVAVYVRRYGDETIARFVRALAETTLLFQSRNTSSAVYRSTKDAQRLLDT